METYEITTAAEADWPSIAHLLAVSKLPVEGLAPHLGSALVARERDRIVGCAALELYGNDALLRSVAVDPSRKGSGLGTALTVGALELARRRQVRRVYLLTETAAAFFPRFGFATVERAAVPDAVRQSVEFTQLCPQSATVMLLELRADGTGGGTR
jgi:amino-acid N-acetyltransferase